MSTIKHRAMEIYQEHLHLAATDGRLFRKTVMEQLMKEFDATLASVATHYNNCKKQALPVEGLGRKMVVKAGRKPAKDRIKEELQPDNECFSVLELTENESGDVVVGRCQSFLTQGDASESFDRKIELFNDTRWIMIQGLGPNHGDTYKLDAGEREIKSYNPAI